MTRSAADTTPPSPCCSTYMRLTIEWTETTAIMIGQSRLRGMDVAASA